MKPVNGNVRAKSGKIGERGAARRVKSGKTRKPKKGSCLALVVQKTTANNDELLPAIPGVEQLDSAPDGSKLIVGDFYADEAELLAKRATCVLDRKAVFIAPRVGWPKGIYRKGDAK